MKRSSIYLLISLIVLLSGCESKNVKTVNDRWYTTAMIQDGKKTYENHCVNCHGKYGQGDGQKWDVKMANGKYPPSSIKQ